SVGGCRKDELSGNLPCLPSVGHARLVRLPGYERLHLLHLTLSDVGQLRELADPLSARELDDLLWLQANGEIVRKPVLVGQHTKDGRLSDSLRPFEDEDVIELAAGLAHTPDSSDKPIRSYLLRVRRVLDT